MTTPAEHLAALARHLETGEVLPECLRAWLGEALRCYHAGASLDHCFGVTEAQRRRQRDRALVDAAICLAPGARPWSQAGKLLRHVNTFAWPFWQSRLPAAWGELQGSRLHLCRAFASGIEIPRSQRQLFTILTAENRSAFAAENMADTYLHRPTTATG